MKRTHYCGDLSLANDGEIVSICGWIQRRRDHGGLIFIDLRDRTGFVQIVFDPAISGEYFPLAEKARPEYVINATGKVSKRPEGQENPNMTMIVNLKKLNQFVLILNYTNKQATLLLFLFELYF